MAALLSLPFRYGGAMVQRLVFVLLVLLLANGARATSLEVYEQAMGAAAHGDDREAVARLQGGLGVLPPEPSVVRERFATAAALLAMRDRLALQLDLAGGGSAGAAARTYLAAHPPPSPGRPWVAALAGVVVPGAGHAWLGRWRDGATVALMVWPMLFLTFWAWRRRMGPVTLFFAMVTVWLWSGTIFSAYSLARRGDLYTYLAWWQGVWQASGLPGRPW